MILDQLIETYRHQPPRTIDGYKMSQDATLAAVFGGAPEPARGKQVGAETGLALSAVYAAVKLLSWTPATLPLGVFERTGDDKEDRRARKDHPVHTLISDQANPEMSAVKFRELGQVFTTLWGRAPAYIERNMMGRPVALWPMHPRDVRVDRTRAGDLVYDCDGVKDEALFPRPPLPGRAVFPDEVVDVQNLVSTGIPTYAREQMGEALAAQEFGGGFFAGGSLFAFAVTLPAGKRVRDKDTFRQNLEKIHGSGRRRIPVFEDGTDVKPLSGDLSDQQFKELREFHVTEIARWFGIPPHKLRELTRATFSNIEEQSIEWVQDLLPWLKLWEVELARKLLTPAERRRLYLRHNVDGLLRGDVEKRTAAISASLQWGWHSINEVRRLEDLNTLGPAGDVVLLPENMRTVPLTDEAKTFYKDLAEEMTPEPLRQAQGGQEPPGDDDDGQTPPGNQAAQQAARTALRSAIETTVGKEATRARQAAKSPAKFLRWIDSHYSAWLAKMTGMLEPAAAACRAVGLEVDAEAIAFEHCQTARAAMLDLSGQVTADKLAERVAEEVQSWRETLPEQLTAASFSEGDQL
jgi:HK97 family phage portal protein